jgi:hypothetical protein
MTARRFLRLAALAMLAATAPPLLARQGWRLASGPAPSEAGRGGDDRAPPWRIGAGLVLAAFSAGGRKPSRFDPEHRAQSRADGREGALGLGGGGRAAAAQVAGRDRRGRGLDLRDWGGSRPAADRARSAASAPSPASAGRSGLAR